MYKIIGIIITLLIFLFIYLLTSIFKKQIKFFITGMDSGFSISDLVLLFRVAEICDLEEPQSLFFSMNSLKNCMTHISNMTQDTNSDPKINNLLSKLFDYRTKLQNQSDEKKSMNSTMFLDKGQKLRIILPGKGVFASEILNCGKEIIISIPKQNNLIPISGPEWLGKVLNVYLWRTGDARYVFDTTVTGQGLFLGKSSLTIKHSNNLVRTQKRKSVRAKCDLMGKLFIMKTQPIDYYSVETKNGYRCHIEDISESGALIRIGGKGVQNVQIKLQYEISGKLVVMFGVIKTIEYNETKNQTLIHFECTHIDTKMRNEILKYVYDILPENEKEILEALEQSETDKLEDDSSSQNDEESSVDQKSENEGIPQNNKDDDSSKMNDSTILPENASENSSDENTIPEPDENEISPDDEINIFN